MPLRPDFANAPDGGAVAVLRLPGGPQGRNDLGARFPAPTAGWTELVPELGTGVNDHLITKCSRTRPAASAGTCSPAHTETPSDSTSCA
ncbi:hypothetical protein AQJ23_40085 [Streptomyces antibioticus]|nr:hypothetical protein [Streptomyces antibioticus]KUN17958.1 hypothetical protein AQJ23_40085 [Streptomyces antibioticus]